jgi:hypothetical protein
MSRTIKKTTMKKRLTFLMLLAMGTGCLFAQKGFNLQFALEPNASFITGDWKISTSKADYTFKKSFTFGFGAGLAGGYNFTDNLGVSLGLGYLHGGQNYKGITISQGSLIQTIENEISLSYVKIPIKFTFNTNPAKSISFSGFAGFYLGFLAGYKQTYNLTGPYPDDQTTYVFKGKTMTENGTDQYDLIGKPFKSTDFGITLGAGLQKKLSKKLFLMVMLNYELGFGDIKNVSSQIQYSPDDLENVYKSDDPNRSVSHKNSSLGLMIGLKKSF